MELPRRDRPDTPESLDGQGMEERDGRSGGTTRRPSGLATPLATFARNFVRATPTVSGRPTRARTLLRSRTAISAGEPAIRCIPRTSRNASSIEIPSTNGDATSKRRTRPCWLRYTPTSAEARLPPAGTTGGLGRRPSRCERRTPSPRSSRRAPRRRRRSPAGRAAVDRPAARPMRRTNPDRRAGSSPGVTRTYVRTMACLRLAAQPGTGFRPGCRVSAIPAPAATCWSAPPRREVRPGSPGVG